MPKYHSSHKKNRLPLILSLLLLFLFGIFLAFKSTSFNPHTLKTEEKSPQSKEIKPKSKKPSKIIKPETDPSDPKEDPFSKKPVQNEGNNPNQATNYTGVITHISVSDKLVIRNSIDQFIQGGGNCQLKLTSGDKIYQTQAPIFNNSSSSTCKGFDIPLSELASGDWDITITVTANNKTGVIKGKIKI